MTDRPVDAESRAFVWVLDCPCGERLQGDSEDSIAGVATDHLAQRHPDMADHYEREHILLIATKLRR